MFGKVTVVEVCGSKYGICFEIDLHTYADNPWAERVGEDGKGCYGTKAHLVSTMLTS